MEQLLVISIVLNIGLIFLVIRIGLSFFNPDAYLDVLKILRELQGAVGLTVPQLAVKTQLPLWVVERILSRLEGKGYVYSSLDMKEGAIIYRSR